MQKISVVQSLALSANVSFFLYTLPWWDSWYREKLTQRLMIQQKASFEKMLKKKHPLLCQKPARKVSIDAFARINGQDKTR